MEEKKKKVSVISRLTLVLETPHQRNQYMAGFLATLTMFITGNFLGWSSPVHVKLLNDETPLKCSSDQWSWAVSFLTLSGVMWAIVAGKLANGLGRRITLLSCGPIFFVSWVIIYYAQSCYALYAARLLAGAGVAIGAAVGSLYIGEISEPDIRGRIGTLVMFSHNLGVLFSLSVGPYVSYKTFAIILATVPIIFFVTFYWMPETPYYRLRQDKRDAAMKSLLKFRGLTDNKNLEYELDTMKRGVDAEMENKSTFTELIRHPMSRRAIIIVLGVKTIQHFSGVSAIQSYMQDIFEEADSFIPASIAGIVCSVVQVFAGLFSSFFVDRFGRKPLLLYSSIGTAVALFFVGLYFFLKNFIECNVTSINWLPLVSIMFFMSAQPVGVGSLSYIFLSELFPANLKDMAAIVSTMYGSFCSFTVIKLFDVISNGLDMFVTFWFCFLIVVGGIVFTIFYVPETKGKTLLQIQNDFNSSHSKQKKTMVQVVV